MRFFHITLNSFQLLKKVLILSKLSKTWCFSVFLSVWYCFLGSCRWGMGLAGFQVGPTFPIFPTFPYFFDMFLLFPYFFLKMPYYPYFFTLKCHLRVRIQKFFLARFACSDFSNLSYFSSRSPPLKHNKILFLTQKLSV